MKLQELADKIGVANRTLRYLVEQSIVHGLSGSGGGRGVCREVNKTQALRLAVAANLHLAGMRGEILSQVTQRMPTRLTKGQDHYDVPVGGKDQEIFIRLPLAKLHEQVSKV